MPFHFIRIDIAGNISKRFSASGIRFARFSGLCPRWNVHSAFMTPGMIRIQLSRMPDGTTYFCVARTVRQSMGGFGAAHPLLAIGLGCEVSHARELVYADGIDLENPKAAVPVGVTCRLCERLDCEQRAFPPIQTQAPHRRERARERASTRRWSSESPRSASRSGFADANPYNPARMTPRRHPWRS